MRIAVLGYIVRGPLGGLVWHHLQYVIGLRRMGHDVYFMEDSDSFESCFDPELGAMTKDPSFGLKFIAEVFGRFGLGERWAYFDAHRNSWFGPCGASAEEVLESSELILNVSGVNPVRDWWLKAPYRVLIDTDPVFTQVRHLKDENKMGEAKAHNRFVTFGENFGKPECTIPDDGFPWLATRQPINLDLWPVVPGNPGANFTTVMQWESYPAATYADRSFGTKSLSFAPYLDLPGRLGEQQVELALGSASAPRGHLRAHGWTITDPLEVTRTPFTYQQFIRESKAEFSVAKHGYHITRSGWFSERSAAYLSSGRPVVTQQTGFSDWLETDGGVLPFDSPESAVERIQLVNRDYERQCAKARAVAEQYFDATSVLSELLAKTTRSAA